ncbi:unnamed protein product [Knipowitschia caucasica]
MISYVEKIHGFPQGSQMTHLHTNYTHALSTDGVFVKRWVDIFLLKTFSLRDKNSDYWSLLQFQHKKSSCSCTEELRMAEPVWSEPTTGL